MRKSETNNHIRQFILPFHTSYFADQYIMYKTFADNFFIKGYLFFSKGDREMGLKVTYFVMPLFTKDDRISYTLGGELFCVKKVSLIKTERNIWWNTTKEYQQDTFERVNVAIQSQGEPILNKITNAEEFYNYHKGERKNNIRVYEAIAYSTILFDDLTFQDKMLRGLIRETENERDMDWVHNIKADAELLISQKSRDERIGTLRVWANETIGHLKLPHIKPFN